MRPLLLTLPALLACTEEESSPRTCNGSTDLCDRRLDEITLPATHNSMSSAADGWQIPNQEYSLQRQLDDGNAESIAGSREPDRSYRIAK